MRGVGLGNGDARWIGELEVERFIRFREVIVREVDREVRGLRSGCEGNPRGGWAGVISVGGRETNYACCDRRAGSCGGRERERDLGCTGALIGRGRLDRYLDALSLKGQGSSEKTRNEENEGEMFFHPWKKLLTDPLKKVNQKFHSLIIIYNIYDVIIAKSMLKLCFSRY